MKFTGENVLAAPVEQAWDALLDPAVLVRTIPGCERLEATGENAYAMTVTAGVASIKGTYAGSCELRDLVEHESLVMKLDGAGAPGTIGATVNVRFSPEGSSTRVSYDADAVVGGMIGGVGQRMLTSVSRRMAGEFFGNVDAAIAGGPAVPAAPVAAAGEAPAVGQVFTVPAPVAAAGSRQEFLTGVAVGAGLVLAGVIVGGIFGRRR
ncbi:SRPBCC family protein [Nocardioides zhouii]|uniref:Carbon monoxide dehydrogenase n=1 Tax=Nocardioides zhouii TaxID=1168729 RepID=A0A4Q2SSJ9_9ACTN|nr:carbon monoxide dehydrogenase subunit G [Nocardioides zhouii]RYC07238.1 carbon monoxide dehydrogenase [Nocardioides zhouii]